MWSLRKVHVGKVLSNLVAGRNPIDVIRQAQDAERPDEQSETDRKIPPLKTSERLWSDTHAGSHLPERHSTSQPRRTQPLTEGSRLLLLPRED